MLGCYELVDSIKRFPVKGFEEFIEIPEEKDEEYILSGKLDFARIGDVFIVPFMSEGYDPLFRLHISAYSKESIQRVSLDYLSLVDENGTIICEEDEFENWYYYEEKSMKVLSHWGIAIYPEVTEKWWYGGNNLTLNIKVSVQGENEVITKNMSYNAEVVQYRTSKWDL